MTDRILYDVDQAAEVTGFTGKDLRLAVNQPYDQPAYEDRYQLPPLPAKRGKRGKLLITRKALEEWVEQLEDY